MTLPRRATFASSSIVLVLVLVLPAAASAYHLDDTLHDGTTGTAEGGSFGPTGWTVTAPTDRLWFSVPTSSSGSIEFSVTGVTNASLFPGDNDMFNLYDDADSGEPIPYRPDFVEDAYKVWVRVRNEPGYYGNQKLTVGLCPDSTISHSSTCACGTGFVEEVTGGDPTWDGTTQRLRIEWGGGMVRFMRNGGEVDRVDYSATGYGWGPRAMHFSIGSTRSRAVSYSGMPIGALFSDLVVDTVDGPVVSCTIMPPPPLDGGVCDPAAVPATEDVTAASWETGVYSVPSDLNVEADPTGAPTAIVYLRFPPVGGPVSHAVLTVHTSAGGSAAGGSGQVCAVASDTWSEAGLTWATRPPVGTACTGGAHAVAPDAEVQWDVTSLVTPTGNQNFAIVSADSDGAHYYSREAGGCALGPRLHVTLATPVDSGTPTDASTPPVDSGTPVDASTPPMDAGPAHDAGSDGSIHVHPTTGGCCEVVGVPASRQWLIAMLAATVIVVSARRRSERRR